LSKEKMKKIFSSKIFWSIIFSLFLIGGAVFLTESGTINSIKGKLSHLPIKEFISKLQAKLFILAQETKVSVIPYYPERLKYLVGEITRRIDELQVSALAIGEATEECDCKNVQSVCQQFAKTEEGSEKSVKNIDIVELNIGLGELRNSAAEIENKLDSLYNSTIEYKKKLEEELQEKLKQENKSKPSSFWQKLSAAVLVQLFNVNKEKINGERTAEELKTQIEKLSEFSQKIKDAQTQIKEISNLPDVLAEGIESTKTQLTESLQQNLNEISLFQQDIQQTEGEFSHLGENLEKEFKSELENIKSELLNPVENLKANLKNLAALKLKELGEFIWNAKCNPGSIETFGDPCPNRSDIDEAKGNIQREIEELAFLGTLLEAERNSDLERELKTLEPEQKKNIEKNLDGLLRKIKKITSSARNFQSLINACGAENCQAVCQPKPSFELKACLHSSIKKQEPIVAKFRVGVGLTDLELGRVGIKNINLSLPQQINLPELPKISLGKLKLPDIAITFREVPIADFQNYLNGINNELPINDIDVKLPSVNLPLFPSLSIPSPSLPSLPSENQWSGQSDSLSMENNELDWNFQTFSWLSEKCQELPTMKDEQGIPTEKMQDCYDQEKVVLTIINECEDFWIDYFKLENNPERTKPLPLIPPICKELRSTCLEKAKSREKKCQELFSQENEPVPDSCSVEILSVLPKKEIFCFFQVPLASEAFNRRYITQENIDTIIKTIKDKCEQLKNKGRKSIPDPCKFLPFFTGKFSLSEEANQEENPESNFVPSKEKIADFPPSMKGMPASRSTIPKLSLPKITIPDIKLPSFRLWPFFELKLPSLIISDLALPEINFCNIDGCSLYFPSFSLKSPRFSIPPLFIPPIELDGAFINISGLDFPSVSLDFNWPNLFNLGNLITPELELPQIKLPRPKIIFKFEGIEMKNLFKMVLGKLLEMLKIDLGFPSGCLSANFHFLPIRITYPDIVYDFPSFPRIPNFCEPLNQICGRIQNELEKGLEKKAGMGFSGIQNILDKTIKEELQGRLDEAGKEANQILSKTIEDHVNNQRDKIRLAIKEHIKKHLPEETIIEDKSQPIKIPTLYYPLGETELPDIDLNKLISTSTPITTISIPWPQNLKKIPLEQDIGYNLPTIPLSNLKYEKELSLKLPGFQSPSASIDLDFSKNSGCESRPASGGNPCARSSLEELKNDIIKSRDEIFENTSNLIEIIERK